jgi:hypothetical protein
MSTLQPGDKAVMYALGGFARGGATRGGYTSSQAYISIGGGQVGTGAAADKRVLVESLTIHVASSAAPNTCAFTTQGYTPALGSEIVITAGSPNRLSRLFAGKVLSEEHGYFLDKPLAAANQSRRINGIDYTWELNQLLVTKRYPAVPVGNIVQDLLAWYAPSFTRNGVDPVVAAMIIDEISFTYTTLSDALSQLCNRVGAYWYVDYYRDLHLFLSEPTTIYPNPTPLTPTHLTMKDVRHTEDLSQMVTRVYVEGGGATCMCDLPYGESLIPVETVAWYLPTGGFIAAGPQRVQYTGVSAGGAGSFVGPGAGPSAAAVAMPQTGAGLGSGKYSYAYTHVTASGESRPSPLVDVICGTTPDYPEAPQDWFTSANFQPAQGNFIPIGVYVRIWASYLYVNFDGPGTLANGPTPWLLTISNRDTYNPNSSGELFNSCLYSSDPQCKYIGLYMEGVQADGVTPITNGPRQWRLFNNDPSKGGTRVTISTRGAQMPLPSYNGLPTANTTGKFQVNVTEIALGPASVTARKLYRTTVNGDVSTLKLVTTLPDNTNKTWLDQKADAALGAAPPGSDTSGLTMPTGQVPSGSTSLPLASAAAFNATGGYVVIGNGEQTVRYTGVGGNSLTGIPASGPGAMTAAVSYNSTATAAPMLTGVPTPYGAIGSLLLPIKKGDDVNLVAVVDDVAAQNFLASFIGGSGVKEAYVQDRRISYTEAVARGRATLNQRGAVDIKVTYTCRDEQTHSGRTIVVNLPAPIGLTGSFKIQDVQIGAFSAKPGQPPTYTVDASTASYSFEDLLRLARGRVGA